MATIQTETRTKVLPSKRSSRRNEITAIALFALGAMLLLCLVFFHPNDPSVNSAGQSRTDNTIGPVGAYTADLLLQTFGLAAYLLPLLLFAASARRFQKKPLRAPLGRVLGLALLLLSTAGLLSLLVTPLFFDGRVRSGGFVGALLSAQLSNAAGGVGALILMSALAAVALLLATNFSFAHAYERVVAAFGSPTDFARSQAARLRTWRAARREAAAARRAEKQAARAEREVLREETRKLKDKTGADRVAEFMRETDGATTPTGAGAAVLRNAVADADAGAQPKINKDAAPSFNRSALDNASALDGASRERSATGGSSAGDANIDQVAGAKARTARGVEFDGSPSSQSPSARGESLAGAGSSESLATRRGASSRGRGEFDEEDVEEMVRDASVVRTEPVEDAIAKPSAAERAAAREAKKLERAAAALSDFRIPPVDFLNAAPPRHEQADEELRSLASRVAEKCKEFNVTGKIEYICPGPVVTTYEFKPDPGVKYSRVTGLVDDLCLALKAESIRIDRVPGKAHVGIEVPNAQRDNIMLREVVESRQFTESASKLTLALGKTIDGLNYVADLARMPHLLIAGATGTGKSVCLNSLVVSILYKARPDEVKFIMIDPKRLELGLYADVPHLATPIITEPKRAANALKWAVGEMERRYKQLAQWGVRNIDGYNAEVARRNMVEDFDEQGEPHQILPYIVVIIDELADLMMSSGNEVEEAITRLAQMARAVGIHLVLATQRPSVDVITGLIKANFPSRIAFRVSSKVDSRTIIDANGAEQLLGRGDMLFLPPGTSRLVRVHGAYVDESEIGRIVAHVKAQGQPVYDNTITQSEEEAAGPEGVAGERDELFEDALRICVEMKRASTSVLQRRLRIGYGRAAAILDAMEREGFIGQADGARPRPVLGKGFETVNHWDELERES
ncbi:MAG: DNA translocase FtsK [Acidobacteriota bacterium]|nr:DNA translocase FtsK [Acidobacteriota bacterium]